MAELQGAEKQRYVADLFTRISGRYDLMNDLMTLGMHRRWKRRTAALAARGQAGLAIDISSGTGDLALELARQPEVEHTVGLDLLRDMVTQANSKVHARSMTGSVTMMTGDALSLPFSDGSFACATAGFSLRNMPDVAQALSEMVRVLRPGGRMAILELSPMPKGLRSALFRPVFHGLVPLIGKLVAGNRSAYSYLPQSVDHFLDADQLAEMLSGLGLDEVGYRRLGFGTVALHWGVKK
ncbi:MAG: ubiquinone/menaquinone biosynthesis methyltransferase [SAR202 cluster bacterium]|nr:ubiquinone/menaquinone biosynthesis methyltransferase [SAR202 cluster bacterium]